jgi:hypothetical protein
MTGCGKALFSACPVSGHALSRAVCCQLRILALATAERQTTEKKQQGLNRLRKKGGIFGKLTEDIPQGLKPVVFLSATYGTTKVVP